jgi:glycerophosphoryl diester phosphodiesterase
MADAPKILGTDTLRDAYPKLNSAIDNSNEAKTKADGADGKADTAIETANTAKTTAEDVQSQFDQVVAEAGENNPEVVQARGEAVNLNARLNATDAQLAERATKISLINTEKTIFFAHRGMENMAPENTLIAFEYAGQLGADGIEFDIQDTSDGVWVLMHDDTVDRTTNGTGTIGSKTLEQVKALTIDAGPFISRYTNTKVPTLEEALIVCKKWGMKALLEIKKTNNLTNRVKIIEDIKRLGMTDSVKIIAPISVCIEMKELEPSIEYGGLLDSFADIDNANPLLPYAHVSMEKNAITKDGVELAHSKGFKVSAWTLNYSDSELADTLKSYGVDYITGTVLS